jgi:hypothetical protein
VLNASPDVIERSLPMVLTTDAASTLSPQVPDQKQWLREQLRGNCPPMFADFFDPNLFVKVPLRKRRYELQIRAAVVAFDAEVDGA